MAEDGMDTSSKQFVTPQPQQLIVKACDLCRKKKIRCQPTEDGCAQCTKSGVPLCHFTPIATKRRPRKPANYKYIKELEERLREVEGRLGNGAEGSQSRSTQGHVEYVPATTMGRDSSIETGQHGAAPDLPTAVANVESPETTSSPSAVEEGRLSPWAAMEPMPSWISTGPFSQPSLHKLPVKTTAIELVEDTFSTFNRFFPLFDKDEFLEDFQSKYLDSNPREPGWWACINVVLALAHRYRAMQTMDITHHNAQACGFIHNALAVVSELIILKPDLPAVQALIGLAMILQGTPNPQISSALIASAVRLAQALGLHRKNQDSLLSESQQEQGRRVFWIAYFLDKDISLRMGHPFAQDDDDIDAELPAQPHPGMSPDESEHGSVDNFNAHIGLAVIQGQIYKKLFSVQASRQSEVQRGLVAEELNTILSYWRKSVCIDFENDESFSWQETLSPEMLLSKVVLRFDYVNCLVMIDRHLSGRGGTRPMDPETQTPAENIGIKEARKAVCLIKVIPKGAYACAWMILHPFFAAAIAILENAIRYPQFPHSRSDVILVEPFMELLDILAEDETRCSKSDEAKRMQQCCRDLHAQAKRDVSRVSFTIVPDSYRVWVPTDDFNSGL